VVGCPGSAERLAGVTVARRRGRGRAAVVRAVCVLAGIGALGCAGSAAQAEGAVTAQGVAAGGAQTCAVLSDGHVDCWGDNEDGQLGNGTYSERSSTPVEVEGLSDATQVTAGEDHTCAGLSGGHVDCWGGNEFGELGNGTETDSDMPVEVQGISDATQVAAGSQYTCAVLSGGHVDCWGRNDEGQLGNGTYSERSSTPVEVQGISDATQVTAGEDHACALLSGGRVDCWGRNDEGQLGNGTTVSSDTPVEVQGVSDATQVTAGEDHTCALLSSGRIDCWGDNEFGELGNGTDSDRSSTPVEVQGISDATQVAAGDGYTCALLSGGRVDCWGENAFGELGNGLSGRVSHAPVGVQGISDATQVTAGERYTCALLSGGRVDCWGENEFGELGDGRTERSDTPVEVQGINDATQVMAGSVDTCAALSDGHIDCWGENQFGDLGDGTTERSDTPVEVQGINDAIQVAAGGSHTCAVLSGGHIDCWGSNKTGQLGNGKQAKGSETPVEVELITDATQVTALGGDTCAVLSSGHVDCWGANPDGELGDGTTESSDTPVEVQGISDATHVTAGYYHTCALLSSGHVDCWGLNRYGQLGHSTNKRPSERPVEVEGISSATEVTAAYRDTCAVLSSGRVDCWGDGSHTPMEVSGISSATQVTAGYSHACALVSGGQIDCWGENSDGELGNGGAWSVVPTEVLFGVRAPVVVSGAATSVTDVSATLNATVNPEGAEVTSCEFEYGPTKNYGSSVPCSSLPGSGESAVEVSASLSGLTAKHAYHFRIVATNAAGTSFGAEATFKTLKG
jgi:alpha-tubulin suppressor-like RCC1 family protein